MKLEKRWFLKIELIVLILVICLWIVKSATIDIASVKAVILKQVVKMKPEDADAHCDLDIVYQKLGSNAEAAKAHKQAVLIRPDLAKATENDLENIDEMQIRQQQSKLLSEQDGRINNLQHWLQNERQNIEKWYEDARQRSTVYRQEVENWYQNNLASLQQWRNAALERLNTDDKGATARFIQNQNNIISYTNVKSVTNGYISPFGYLSANTSSFGVSSTSVLGDPAYQFRSETAYIANSRIAVENTYQEELGNLQNQKSRCLNSASENSLQCEKTRAIQEAERYVENASKVAASNKRDIITATEDRLAGGPGVVIGAISSNGKNPLCMVGEDIYHQGDTINGFKIQKISDSEVIFEKDGKTVARGLQ